MKTRKEWIDTLPKDIRKRAYKYTEKVMLGLLKVTLSEAISGAFFWSKTSEGHLFWSLVAKGEFDQAREFLTQKNTKP